MSKPIRDWPRAMAARIGIAGSIDFTRAAVGQTLHIPCAKGNHVVDVKIDAHQHPDVVAKKLLHAGWTISSRPTCPDHARGKKRGHTFTDEDRLKALAARALVPREVNQAAGAKRWAGIPPEERRAQMAALRSKTQNKQEEQTPMPESAYTPPPAPTDAAKRAHRAAMSALEDYYDEAKKCYRPEWNDKRIAEETGASEAHVRETREKYFGPLTITRPAEFDALVAHVAQARADADARHVAEIAKVDALADRLRQMSVRNGWAAT